MKFSIIVSGVVYLFIGSFILEFLLKKILGHEGLGIITNMLFLWLIESFFPKNVIDFLRPYAYNIFISLTFLFAVIIIDHKRIKCIENILFRKILKYETSTQ